MNDPHTTLSCPRQSPGQFISRGTLLMLFAGVTTLGFITSHGTLSVDPATRYHTAKSLVNHGDVMVRLGENEPPWPGMRLLADGNYYSHFGIGQALIFAGPYWFCHNVLGIESDKLIRSIISLTVFPLTLGLTAVVFALLLGEFGFESRHCYLWGAGLVFATGLWQVSKEGQEASHLALLFTLAAYCLRRYQRTGSAGLLAGFSAVAGFCFLIRTDTAPTLLCFFALSFWLIHRTTTRRLVIHCGSLIVPALVALAVHIYVTFGTFGTFVPPHPPFSPEALPTGLAGLLVSPGRSLFLYNPIFILAFPGLLAMFRRHRCWAIFAFASFLGCLFLHAAAECFHGNCCWGPRYLCRVFPFLMLFAAAFGLTVKLGRGIWKFVFVTIISASLLVQIAAVSLHHVRELSELAHAHNVDWSDGHWTMFEPEASFLKIRVKNIGQSVSDMANGNIPAWPETDPAERDIQQQLSTPVLHYLAFWPFHLTYYMPTVKPSLAMSLWQSSLILLVGVAIAVGLLVWGLPRSSNADSGPAGKARGETHGSGENGLRS